jgi:hypothetical protein
LGAAAGAARAGEDEVTRLEHDVGLGLACLACDRHGLAGQRRRVDLQASCDQSRVGRDPVALVEEDDVAGHELAGIYELAPFVAEDGDRVRQKCRQCLDRPLGLVLLQEREDGVEQDDGDDGAGEDGCAREPSRH